MVAAANPRLFFFFLLLFHIRECDVKKKKKLEGTGRSLCRGEALFLKGMSQAVFTFVFGAQTVVRRENGRHRAEDNTEVFGTRFLFLG